MSDAIAENVARLLATLGQSSTGTPYAMTRFEVVFEEQMDHARRVVHDNGQYKAGLGVSRSILANQEWIVKI